MAAKQLQRFLYLATDAQSFTSGDSEFHQHFELEKVPFIQTLLQESPDALFSTIEACIGDPLLPTKHTVLFCLAVTSSLETTSQIKNQIYQCVHKHTKSDEDFFAFIKFKTKLKKTFSSGFMKVIEKHYTEKTPDELWKSLGVQTRYHGWSHKDLMKLSHINPKEKYTRVGITYVMKGHEEALKEAGDDAVALNLLEKLEKCREYRQTKDVDVAVKLQKELQFGLHQIPMNFKVNGKILELLMDDTNMKDIVTLLPQLYKANLLSQHSVILSKVLTNFVDPKVVAKSKVLPVDAYIGYRNFIKGGKPQDPQYTKYLEAKPVGPKRRKTVKVACVDRVDVEDALLSAINLSYPNVVSCNKRFIVTVSLDDINKACITSKNMKCVDAAAITVLELYKTEKSVKLFVNQLLGHPVLPVNLEKSDTVLSLVEKIRFSLNIPRETKEILTSKTIFHYVDTHKEEVDVFINFNFCVTQHYSERLMQYSAKLNSKVVTCSLGSYSLMKYPEHMLDIRGFDRNTVNVIRAFALNRF